jgi:hypothetical protein
MPRITKFAKNRSLIHTVGKRASIFTFGYPVTCHAGVLCAYNLGQS